LRYSVWQTIVRRDKRKGTDLKTRVEKCIQCFPAEANTISHSALSWEMAAKIFGNMQESGNLPVMCQQSNGRFFVCYELNDASERGNVTAWP